MEFRLGEAPRMPLICHVCGDIARGMNFDVITCMSCKAFFRRNAFQRAKLTQCQFNNNCVINQRTRSACAACRLRKCFALGMNPDLIRSPYQPNSKRQFDNKPMEEMIIMNLPLPQPIDLLNHDRSSLTVAEWNLLSNMIHSYDRQQPAQLVNELLKQQASLPLKLRSKPMFTLELIASFYSSVEPMIRETPLFLQCPTNVRRQIVQNNMTAVGSFNAMIASMESDLFDSEIHRAVSREIYGDEYILQSYRVLQNFDSNRLLVKVMMIISAFSTNASMIVFNHFPSNSSISQALYLARIQDSIVTIFWKYLIYRYGFSEASIRYANLIKNHLDILQLLNQNSSHDHQQMVSSIVDQMNGNLSITH